MVSESDSGMVISKRPKTKIGKELSNVSNSEEPDGLKQESKKGTSALCEDVSVKHKKAIKRIRESDEESSITSDDESMSKKRIRKNSEDRCVSERPKKVVSDAARRRREALKAVRENKMAALESDSESDSDVSEFRHIRAKTNQGNVEKGSDNKSEDDSTSNSKKHSNSEEGNVARNPKSLISSVKDKKSQREKTSEKTVAKNEESSSAYNSDSDNGKKNKESSETIRFEDEQRKCNSDNKSTKFPKRKSSLLGMKKSGKCVDSGSDVDSEQEHIQMACLEKKSFNKCDENSKGKCEVDIKQKDKHHIQSSNSDDELNSSKDESTKDTNVNKKEKMKQISQNTPSSCNESSSDEGKINKESSRKQKIKLGQKISTKSRKDEQPSQGECSSDSDRQCSSSKDDTSNDDSSFKKAKPQKKDAHRKGRAVDQSLKGQNSFQEESCSENEHPSKKTKSSTKAQSYSDSEKSNISVDLKSQSKSKSKKNDSESSESDFENCKPSNKTKLLKCNKTPLKQKITVTKKEISDTSDSEGESEPVKEKKMSEKVYNKSKRSKKKSTASSNVSSDDAVDSSDNLTLKKSKVKVTPNKSDTKLVPKKVQKISDESELSDIGRENNLGKKQVNDSIKKPSEVKKEPSDSETSSGERKSENKSYKSFKVSKAIKKEKDSNDSDSTSEMSKCEVKHEISDSANSSDSEYDGKNRKGTEGKVVKTKETNKNKSLSSDSDNDSSKNVSKKNKKAPGKMEIKINNLKKYVRACGIRINNYTTFWEGCKNDKQKADKLSKVLEDFGLKGKPSLQRCKKLRKKAERKREVEELDLSNIIDTEENAGYIRRRGSRRMSIKREESPQDHEQKAAERAADWKRSFSRIKDLCDSDSSSG
ncbi:Uncharacterized protein GBIM_13134 [Gryllus bimaculatus]|nr:Uncharacterized protein GBIM_13134 [Gryllus bimaculatus]